MNDIKKFVAQWSGRGYEKGESHSFWLSLLRDVFGISEPEKFIRFEVPVKLKHTSFIDAFLPDTKVIIEQKSLSENLSQEKSQSDGSTLTPYEQAQRYGSSLPYSMRPRWIVVCNFAEFLLYDMETLAEPTKILLDELPEKFHALDFLVDKTKNKLRIELELSLKAGEIVGKLYDALHSQYLNPDNEHSLASLNKLCVRLVFCLYAESAGIFGKHKISRDYLAEEKNIRRALLDLFSVLNTPVNARDPYLDDTLKKFPFVNGGLFAGAIEIPNFTPEIKNLLLEEASSGFNWAGISPTIFGAVFESTLNPVTRRAAGMHYTSLENIHKVIDPLFLDDLRGELQSIKQSARNRKKNLLAFQNKLANIKIFDPACGSGNFLTESYLSLRRLENEILKELFGSQIQLGELVNPIKVSIGQFYGIEINDFAVAVAQTALWIAELQMIQETQEIIHHDLDFLPLKSYANIHEANALQTDWQEICPQPNYIIGNPPFVGKSFQTPAQKSDMANIFASISGFGNLDYVACWFKKAADFIAGTKTACAFVATNSIGQGIAVSPLWTYLFGRGVVVNFVHQTFKWTSESADIAAVHCVIVGFANFHAPTKLIFNGQSVRVVENINAYLLDAPNVIVLPQANPLREDVPPMIVGSCPTDGGNFLLTADERDDFIKRESAAEKWIRRYVGSNEFINNIMRYCLWLKDCPPNVLRKMPIVMKRVEGVRNFRLASKKAQTRHRADTPTLFAEDRFVDAPALFVPMVSSENRRYIPMGFVNGVVINNKALFIPNCDLYTFGMLTSSIHMTWVRTVAGRLKSDYSYGTTTVYNTFPWCKPTDKQRHAIEQSAQKILDVRANYPDATLADLYDPLSMPKDLRDAHKKNDRAVASAYGFENILDDESKITAELLNLYISYKNNQKGADI
ncbi:MAG: class I SAM-dependent DNA methyltransferase [Selenomonadaceae bacterium]|nr:class I SAM-dependent DNA methyltransferase [Selenomonadaceae bacterium]